MNITCGENCHCTKLLLSMLYIDFFGLSHFFPAGGSWEKIVVGANKRKQIHAQVLYYIHCRLNIAHALIWQLTVWGWGGISILLGMVPTVLCTIVP